MKINRENYEIWFVDWLDGRLSGDEIEELNYFLDHNPDLRDEFTDLSAIELKPGVRSLPRKEQLKRSPGDISGKQFEILCAASLENDLDAQQLAELNEMISSDPEKAKTLRIFSSLKLSVPEIYYANRKKLVRTTPVQKVMRIAWIGLSAAAIVTILLMTGVFRNTNRVETGQVVAKNNSVQLPSSGNKVSESSDLQSSAEVTETGTSGKSSGYSRSSGTVAAGKVIEPVSEREQVAAPEKIAFTVSPQLAWKLKDNLIMPNTADFIPPENTDRDDDRSNVGKFLARHFRSKILDEDVPSDAPLKGYEIAEAGIDGLNKLLGWEMALSKRTDENGEIKSLNFNSRMLKFNTPVKNNSQAE